MAIVLEKSGDQHRINLEKGCSSFSGEIIINLDWSKGGFLKQMFGNPVDLDLGCFYELRDGSKMLIDGLQFSRNRGGNRHQVTRQGCYDQKPFIWHQGDDRGGGSSSGETILVNPKGVNDIKRIVVYTFIFEGVAKWAETNAVVKVKVPGNEDIIVDIAFYNTGGIRTSFIVEDGEMEKDITYGDIYTMLPFNNPLLIYELTAQELKQHLINSIREDNYGDQMTGLCFEYKKDKNSNEVEIVKMYLVDDDGNKTAIDVNDTTTRYTICLPRYNATLEGSVTKNKTPINNEAIAIVDNQAIIEILEYERDQNKPSKFKIEVDLEQRAIKVDE